MAKKTTSSKKTTKKKTTKATAAKATTPDEIGAYAAQLAVSRRVAKPDVGRAVQALIDFDNATKLRVSKVTAQVYEITIEQFN